MKNILELNCKISGKKFKEIDAYEIGLPTKEKIVLPCGASALASN